MRLLPALAPLGLAAALFVAPVDAYTPESGIWWNPNASGGGYVIEIQDNFMGFSYFGGDAQGRATWWTAAGLMTGNALFENMQVNRTVGSQCIGCPYTGFPQVLLGDGGRVTVRFDPNDNTKATVSWNGGTPIPIERQQFYFKQSIDPPAMPMQSTLLLGEWQMVLDFSSNSGSGFDFYGDVLVFDDTKFNPTFNRWEVEGCRADNSEVGGCSNFAIDNHYARGYYDVASKLHVIYVEDTPQNNLLYLIDTATNSGIGEITVYPFNRDPDDYDAYPMRSFRTASRKFVQTGTGPAKAAPMRDEVSIGLSDRLAASGITPLAKSDPRAKLDRAALSAFAADFAARLEAKRASR